MSGPTVGPFRLVEPAGAGAMGEVWRAVHPSGLPVAIKRIKADVAANPRFESDFREEARSVARLQHPHVIRVLDAGVQDGEPWLAMEWADSGSLPWEVTPWGRLVPILRSVLRGLAHAHARGLVHRDVKPANILRCGEVWKLGDFGLARHLETARDDQLRSRGTPVFMAPEQIRGALREQGPATDLYAVGCMTWMLVCGEPPFAGSDNREVLQAHLSHALGAFGPRTDVPDGLLDWLLCMLSPRADERPSVAADALAALEALGPAVPAQARPAVVRSFASETWTDEGLDWTEPEEVGPPAERPRIGPAPLPAELPDEAVPEPLPLATGLGLYERREHPLIGRRSERRALWEALVEVHRGASRGVVMHGPAGCGKSRLARWLAELAHESGLGRPVTLRHGAVAGAADGIAGAIAREHRLHGLDPEPAAGRVLTGLVGAEDADVLAQIALRGGGRLPLRVRRAAIGRWLRLLAWDRPLVLWVDDAQWGEESVAVAEAALSDPDLRVLVLWTVRDEALVEQPRIAERLAGIAERTDVGRLPVAPLEDADQGELIAQLIGLDAALVDAVRERTAGNPLFAVQLVGDWIRRGLLEVHAGGYRLPPGARPELPDDLHTMWSGRVERLLDHGRDGTDRQLELAALLGQEIVDDEWERAAGVLGVPDVLPLRARLIEERLADATEVGLAFVHGMLRESVERRCREAGRARELHAACASAIEGEDAHSGLRRGAHQVAAGLDAQAMVSFRRSAGILEYRGEHPAALRALDEVEAAMDRLGRPDDHQERAELFANRIGVLFTSGGVERARALGREMFARFDPERCEEALVAARTTLSHLEMIGHRLQDARAHLLAIVDTETVRADPRHACSTALSLSQLEFVLGNLRAAEVHLEPALALVDSPRVAKHLRVDVIRFRAILLELRGDYPQALSFAERSRDLALADQVQLGVVFGELTIGHVLALMGDDAAATEAFERGLRAAGARPLRRAQVLGNRAHAHLLAGRFDQALRDADAAIPALAEAGRVMEATSIRVLRCLARLRMGQDAFGDVEALLSQELAPGLIEPRAILWFGELPDALRDLGRGDLADGVQAALDRLRPSGATS